MGGNLVNAIDPTGENTLILGGLAIGAGGGAIICATNPVLCRKAFQGCFDSLHKMFNEATEKKRFIVDSNGETVDTDVTPEGSSYKQPNGGRTDILQGSDHGSGRSHTHDPKINTAPNGDTFINGLNKSGRDVSYDDIQNIKSGIAKPAPPMKR